MNALLRSLSIKRRLLIGFIVVPLFVLIIIYGVYDSISKQDILAKSENTAQQLLAIVTENFNLNVNKFEQQLDEIMTSPLIYECIDEAASTDYQARRELYTALNDSINTKTHFLSNASELAIYTKDGQLTYSKGYYNFDEGIVSSNMKESDQALGRTVWFHTSENDESIIGLSRAIYDEQGEDIAGYLFVALHETAFTSLFSSEEKNENAIIIVDEDNQYLFGQFDLEPNKIIFEDGQESITLGIHRYYINAQLIQDIPWKVVYLTNETYVMTELNSLRFTMLCYMGVIFFILFSIMIVIYNSIYNPIDHILTSMNQFSEKNLNVNIVDEGNDELHELAENYNSLVSRIQDLVETVEQKQGEKREAEIKMLQAQINPHFLFNTLNTLRYLAILNEDKPLNQGITALAKLLRNTITDSKELVDITDEIENVKNYIIIQKLRYGNLFDTNYQIDPELAHCKIMKFLLQPIVENAILHGFQEDLENQVLQIRIEKDEHGIMVEVKDNGKGFAISLQEEKISNKLSGIGMRNIKERIQLTYGEAYHMQIMSVIDKGTTVTLILPYIENEEGDTCIE